MQLCMYRYECMCVFVYLYYVYLNYTLSPDDTDNGTFDGPTPYLDLLCNLKINMLEPL